MKIVHKLLLGFGVVILLICVIAYLSLSFGKNALQESIIDNSVALAVQIIGEIDMALAERIDDIEEYSKNTVLQQTVKKSNADFDLLDDAQAYINKIDLEWTSVPTEETAAVMNQSISNRLARELKEKKEYHEKKYRHRTFAEIFVTNKYGAVIAQTDRTTDYRQDDEEWWQKAKTDGTYIEDVRYDKSADTFAISFGIRIGDKDGKFIGVMKAVLDMEEITDIMNIKAGRLDKHHKTMHLWLARSDGKLIYSTQDYEVFEDISAPLFPIFVRGIHPSHENYYVSSEQGEKEKLYVHAHSTGYDKFKGLGWILLISHNTDEIFKPINILTYRIITSVFFIALFGVFFIMILCLSIKKPIDNLKKSIHNFSAGNLDTSIDIRSTDEIGELASSFRTMARDLRKNTENLISKNYQLAEVNAMLQESEEKFRTISITAADAIIVLDDEGKILEWNKAAEQMFGYSKTEAYKKELHSLLAPETYHDDYRKGFAQFRKSGSGSIVGKTVEISAIRKNGTEFPIEVSTSSMNIKGKWHAVGIVRDISDRKRAEAELLQKQSELLISYKISSAINETIEMYKLFDIILETVTNINFLSIKRKGGIFLIEDDKMHLVSHLGHPDDFLRLHRDMRIGTCLCGKAAETGEIILCKNADDDDRHEIRYPEMSPHGHVIIPLKAKLKTVVVLYLYLPVDFEIDEPKVRLLHSIGNQIGLAIENARLYEETKKFALYDPLTKLSNRRMLDIEIERSLARAKRLDVPFSIILIDIDHFKKYNDKYGHIAGDRLLVNIAGIILKESRGADLVARYGGEEFIILLPDTKLAMATEAAERIRKAVENKSDVTISLGVASYFKEIKTEEELINRADEALYHAKHRGRNRVEVYSENNHPSLHIS